MPLNFLDHCSRLRFINTGIALNIKIRDMAAIRVRFCLLGLTGKESVVVSADNEYLDQNTTLLAEIAEKGLGFSKKKLDLDKNQLLRHF